MLPTVRVHRQEQQHRPEDRELVDDVVVRAVDGGDADIRMVVCYVAAGPEIVLGRVDCVWRVPGLKLARR